MTSCTINFSVELPFLVKKKRNWFIASCSVLDVHSQGETEKRAVKNLREALELFLSSCFERGTLDAVLKECGFKLHKYENKIKTPKTKQEYIHVPIPMEIDKTRSCSCPA